jgi:hypothetical protein
MSTLICFYTVKCERRSVVGTATALLTGRSGSQIPAGIRDIILQNIQTDSDSPLFNSPRESSPVTMLLPGRTGVQIPAKIRDIILQNIQIGPGAETAPCSIISGDLPRW